VNELTKSAGNNFDFLRFFFASLVIFSHSYPLGTGTEALEPLALYTHGQMTLGALAVDCFFIISGFLISQSWNADPRIFKFLKKRIRRIYPGFIVASAICAFVLTPLFSNQGSSFITLPFVASFFGHVLRLLDIYPGPAFQGNPAPGPVNGSLWSISYEFWCYIGILICGICGILQRRFILVIGLLGAMVLSFIFQWFNLTPGGKWLGAVIGYLPIWARLLPYFLAGMVFHAFRQKIIFNRNIAFLFLALTLLALRVSYVPIFLLPISVAYIVFWFAFLPLGSLSGFAKYGDFSYGIYLYSFPILQIIAYLHGAQVAPELLFGVAWPIAIAIGAASWFLVEKRWLVKSDARARLVVKSSDDSLGTSSSATND
jgi:peptidoglycan/LPS O-acetylase OafA/YrhL